MENLLDEVRKCTHCAEYLPLGPRPVLRAHPESKIIVIGQAPGTAVHASGIPWDDPSGDNLRKWMNISTEDFYDERKLAIIPMGFCYPGRGKSGDLPPRKECAPKWHADLFAALPQVQLILLIGQYAQKYYLPKAQRKRTLTDTVRHFQDYLPRYFVLPHPSPRNNIWQAKNPWFKDEVVPSMEEWVHGVLGN
ncbi:MAG: uracil-DNA glycosylase family protein [Bacteroidota bacterium]